MMAPTHVAVGPVLSLPLLAFAPELAAVGAVAAICGGVFPDLDLFVGQHRKTLHYPALYWLPAASALAVAAVAPTEGSIAAALFFTAAAVHSGLDAFDAGETFDPWNAASDRGVYLHRERRWIRPRRWIRYDGAPEDVGLAFVLSVPGLLWFGPTVRLVVAIAVVLAVVYGLVRRRIPPYVEPLVD